MTYVFTNNHFHVAAANNPLICNFIAHFSIESLLITSVQENSIEAKPADLP